MGITRAERTKRQRAKRLAERAKRMPLVPHQRVFLAVTADNPNAAPLAQLLAIKSLCRRILVEGLPLLHASLGDMGPRDLAGSLGMVATILRSLNECAPEVQVERIPPPPGFRYAAE